MLVMASGNIVHNLGRVAWHQPDAGGSTGRNDSMTRRDVLANNPADVLELTEHSDFAVAVPTPDHFIPLLYFAGLVAEAGTTTQPFVDGCTLGSLSMTSYALDCSTGAHRRITRDINNAHTRRPGHPNQHVTTPHIRVDVRGVGHRSYAGVFRGR